MGKLTIKEVDELTSAGITTTYVQFTFNDIICVDVNLRSDICLNATYQNLTIIEIEKIYDLVVAGGLTITIDSTTQTAVPNIYFLNKYY